MNFNQVFKGNVTYDIVTSQWKAGLPPLPRKYIFGEKNHGGDQLTVPAFLQLNLK